MGKPVILAIDQGTTGTKVLALDQSAKVVGQGFREHTQYYPQSGWVEHDAVEIWETVKEAAADALKTAGADPSDVAGVGLDNQGETVMIWDSATGKPLHKAIVWQDRRTAEMADAWSQDGDWSDRVLAKTGLRIDSYFSATKIRWLLDHVPEAKAALAAGRLRIGTLDTWLCWCLSGGKAFVTDPSTAARTLLFNIHTEKWDPELLDYLEIPASALPEVLPTLGRFCMTDPDAFLGVTAPVTASLVDQPASLYGHLCLDPGGIKCTYGTGCFMYMNTGHTPVSSKAGLLSTIVWDKGTGPVYALDGGVYTAGTAMKWLLKVGLLQTAAESEELALSVSDTDVTFVPALTGLAAPFWNSDARAGFFGISAGAGRADLVRAVLEGVAHRVADVAEAMGRELGAPLPYLRVDGGMTRNAFLMQFQADILGVPVDVCDFADVTSLGTGFVTGEALGWWTPEELNGKRPAVRTYRPQKSADWRQAKREKWRTVLAADQSIS